MISDKRGNINLKNKYTDFEHSACSFYFIDYNCKTLAQIIGFCVVMGGEELNIERFL